MIILRPVKESDFDAIVGLTNLSKIGITSLPKDPKFIKNKIEHSIEAFNKNVDSPNNESYLFALINTETSELLGTSGINAKVGINCPFYSYKIQTMQQACPAHNIYQEHKYLELTETRRGPTEICSLFLSPSARGLGLAKLLSLARFLFMGSAQERFQSVILAEMFGTVNDDGSCPFWDCIMKPFFQMNYVTATHFRLQDDLFIHDLIPKYPIYLDLLPQSIQNVIGVTHPDTVHALNLLKSQGFFFHNEIDIFDGGPNVYANLHDILTLKNKRISKIAKIVKKLEQKSDPYLICHPGLNFIAAQSSLNFNDNHEVIIDDEIAKYLNLECGSEIHFSPLPRRHS